MPAGQGTTWANWDEAMRKKAAAVFSCAKPRAKRPGDRRKTLLAKAMAGESDVAFIPAVASAFVTKWQGSGPEAVRTLFKRARRYAPAASAVRMIAPTLEGS